MRAIQMDEFGGPDVLAPVDVLEPALLPTEVLVRTAWAGVNPVDWKTRAGKGMVKAIGPLPWIPGWDVAGTVEDVGDGVTRFQPGDAVFGMPWFPRRASAYAEFVSAPSRQLAAVPEGVDLTTAGALPLAGLTAWQTLVDVAALEADQRVLVTAAAGGVGHLAVQLAAARGAHVVGTARGANHEFLRGLGADEVIDYTKTSVPEQAGELDVVLDLAGVEPARLLDTLRPGGLLIRATPRHDAALQKEAEGRGVRTTSFLVEPDGAGLESLAGLVSGGDLRVEIAETFPLAQAAEAHRRSGQGHTRGKLVLAVE